MTPRDQSLEPAQIERPWSALHAGDFTDDHTVKEQSPEESPRETRYQSDSSPNWPLGTSPTTPWYTPSSYLCSLEENHPFGLQGTAHNPLGRRPSRTRAPSLNSYTSSSYVLKAPTTPLIHQSNNTDLDFSPRDRSISPEKSNRRRTLPPHAFQNVNTDSHWSISPQPVRQSPPLQRQGSFPYGHQPRRSLTSNWSLQASNSPQTPPYLRSRRTSLNTEASPLQHASMVGSYEESILRGWMSTAPSRPLDFTAQIGVLGRGNHKPKCPPHVTVPFPAVYYSWSAGNGRSAISDDPSPYVGHIDLQQSLEPAASKETPIPGVGIKADLPIDGHDSHKDITPLHNGTRKSKKRRRTSPSGEPPKGSYRIPQQGQVQVIIKNPNKTAVKLFLVPYDLESMEPGTKTFVRQRSYSANTVIDTAPGHRPSSDPVSFTGKPTLRYLIHLNICSPSKGRFYLYHQIRVVFANRVPDNKEKLQNEIQVPTPRFNAHRPNRESLFVPSSNNGTKSIAERAYRRRSSGFGFRTEEIDGQATRAFTGGSTFPFHSGPAPPTPAIPFNIAVSRQKHPHSESLTNFDDMELDASRPATSDDTQSPLSEKSNRLIGTQLSSSHKSSSSQGSDGYNKLNKGESGYGGILGRPGTPEPGEGLLAKRLKRLGMHRDVMGAADEV